MCRTPSRSSRIAAMAGESIRVTRSVSIPRSEIELRFSRSSGPGGQHAQKTETRAEAVFDVERSVGLSDAQKRRVIARAGPVLRAVAQDERLPPRCVDVALRLGLELRLAALAAEVVGVACIRRGRLARTAVDRHPADGIPRAPAERQRDEDRSDRKEDDVQKGGVVPGDAAA